VSSPPTPVVLQVLPALKSGGVERGTIEVATALRAANHRALVASNGGRMVAELEAVGAEHFTLPLNTKNPLKIWRNVTALEKLIRAQGVNIVHARSRAPAWSAYYAAKRCGVPFITTYHAAYNIDSKLRHRYASVMARGDKVIAISRYIENTLRTRFGVPPERIALIYRGFDHAAFNPASVTADRTEKLRTEWKLPPHVPVVLCPGRVSRTKGQDILLQALGQIKELPFVCVLAGDNQGRSDVVAGLEKIATAHGIADRLIMSGAYRDAPAVMLLADVIVTPATLPEAFGRTTAEAQAMGRWVISTNNGAAPEIISDGQTGGLVPASDPTALAAALRRFFALTPEQRHAAQTLARKQALERFSTEKMCAATLAVYESVLTERPAPK